MISLFPLPSKYRRAESLVKLVGWLGDTTSEAPRRYHIMLNSKAPWAYVPEQSEGHHRFDEYPDSSIEDWHRERGLLQ